MSTLLVNQRQKSQLLESEWSVAQDRIGGAKQRVRMLEEENVKSKGNCKVGMNIIIKKESPQKSQ